MTRREVPEADFEVFAAPSTLFLGKNWCVRCRHCGQLMTKYAFSEEDALEESRDHLKGCSGVR